MASLTRQRPVRPDLTERAGGWILAVCLHVMLLSALVLAQLPQPAPASEEPQPITITFEPAEPEAPVEPEAVAETRPEPEPAASMPPEEPAAAPEGVETFEPAVQVLRPEELEAPAMPEPEEPVATPEQEQPEPTAEPEPEPAATIEPALAEPTPDPALQAQVEEFLNADFLSGVQAAATPEAEPAPVPGDERGELALPLDPRGQDAAAGEKTATEEVLAALEARRRIMDAENRRRAMEGSTEVAQRLRLGSADQAAQKTLQSDPRRRDGVVRTVTTEGVSQEAADEVLKRWGFRVMIARTEGGKSGGYLSGVKTNDGTFVSPQGPGLYRILRFDHNTVARLARLEDAALAASGHDMAKVRVTKIVFGVVATGDGYDLAVTDLEVVPLPAEPIAGAHADPDGVAVRRVR